MRKISNEPYCGFVRLCVLSRLLLPEPWSFEQPKFTRVIEPTSSWNHTEGEQREFGSVGKNEKEWRSSAFNYSPATSLQRCKADFSHEVNCSFFIGPLSEDERPGAEPDGILKK